MNEWVLLVTLIASGDFPSPREFVVDNVRFENVESCDNAARLWIDHLASHAIRFNGKNHVAIDWTKPKAAAGGSVVIYSCVLHSDYLTPRP